MKGEITAADGSTPIPGATVGLAAEGSKSKSTALRSVRNATDLIKSDGPTATTDENGEYTLKGVPSGKQTLAAKRGVFETTFDVNVKAGETTQSKPASVQPAKDLAVVLGSYDSIEKIIEKLGYASSLDTLNASALSDANTLRQYAAVFVNCGASGSYTTSEFSAMETYMSNGGTVYLSDLEQDYVEGIYPNAASFNNNTATQTVTAAIQSTDLQKYVGADSVDIRYDLPSWERITDVSSKPAILLEGQPKERSSGTEPLAVTIANVPGRMVYTTFHNEAGATTGQEAVLRYYIYIQ